MATIKLDNDFLEYDLTPAEMERACKFLDAPLTALYLRNHLAQVMRQLAYLDFTPENQELSMRQHIHLSGQRDILTALLAAYETPVPAPGSEQSPLPFSPGA